MHTSTQTHKRERAFAPRVKHSPLYCWVAREKKERLDILAVAYSRKYEYHVAALLFIAATCHHVKLAIFISSPIEIDNF